MLLRIKFCLGRCLFSFCLHLQILHFFQLPVQKIKLALQVGKRLLQLLTTGCLFCQLCLRVQLRLRHLLDDDLAHLNIRNIIIIDNLFLDFLNKFGFYRLPLFLRDLAHLTRIRLQQALKYRIIGNQVDIHLQQILFVKFQRTVLLLDRIADFIVVLDKLPQLIARPVIRILHHQVCPLDRAVHTCAAVHNITKGTRPQNPRHPAHTVDPLEYAHVIGVIFHQALAVSDLHFHFIGNFLIRIVNRALHAHDIARFIAGRPEDDIRPLVHKCKQPLDQMINETVFIQIITFLRRHI